MKFTKETTAVDSSFPFLNVEVKITNSTFSSWIYHIPTNTNVFLDYKVVALQS